jgi:hypothetical protein
MSEYLYPSPSSEVEFVFGVLGRFGISVVNDGGTKALPKSGPPDQFAGAASRKLQSPPVGLPVEVWFGPQLNPATLW